MMQRPIAMHHQQSQPQSQQHLGLGLGTVGLQQRAKIAGWTSSGGEMI